MVPRGSAGNTSMRESAPVEALDEKRGVERVRSSPPTPARPPRRKFLRPIISISFREKAVYRFSSGRQAGEKIALRLLARADPMPYCSPVRTWFPIWLAVRRAEWTKDFVDELIVYPDAVVGVYSRTSGKKWRGT